MTSEAALHFWPVATRSRRDAAATSAATGSQSEPRRGDEELSALDEHERADHALRASEARYRQALADTEAALARTQALYLVSSALVAAEGVGTLLQRVVDSVATGLRAWRVNLFALDVERRLVTANVLGGPGGKGLANLDFDEILEGLGGWVLRERKAVLSSGLTPDPRESRRVQERRRRTSGGSMVVAPIFYGDSPLGVIVAVNRTGEREFEQRDVDLLAAMADQSAVAIEGAAVRDELQAARDKLEDRVARRTAEVAASEERYRRITETITDYVFHVTIEGGRAVATRHGQGCVAVTGYCPEDFEADPGLWLAMVLPQDREDVLAQAREVETDQQMRSVEHRICRKEGSVRWVRSTPVPQYSADGELVGYDGLIQDITERRTLEEQLAQSQRLQSIGRLAGGVAHDFNNMLTAILGNAELALLDLGTDHPARSSIDEIVKAAEGAARLTRQLLAFASRQMIEPVPLNLSAVVESSLNMLRRLLGEDLEIIANLDKRLAPVEADPGQIQQVLVNLTVNARDAMRNGGRLVIETANAVVTDEDVATWPEVVAGPYVSLIVSDTGTGMSEEAKAHLFEPFFTTKGQGKGTGLGLATCHGIVKQSGGHIWIHSEPGQGTAVTILLPQSTAKLGRAAGPSTPQAPARGTETVLVVEDEPSVRRLAVLGLRSNGYTVLEAGNAAEALRMAGEETRIDLLVSDVIMPGMRGPELAKRLREIRPEAKLLLTSGHADTADAFRDPQGRLVPFLQKPFTPGRLAHKVRAVLDEDA